MANALILVDLQNDFLPGGALAVPDGDAVIPVANDIMKRFDIVVASQDWHPPDHGSFASRYEGKKPGQFVELNGLNQILWPDHCVWETRGAQFAPGLATEGITRVFRKGMDREVDSYSCFFDNDHRRDTGLGDYLNARQVVAVTLMGLATDYCVKYSVLDACQLGLKVKVLQEGVRGVEITPGDCQKAFEEMQRAGAVITRLKDL